MKITPKEKHWQGLGERWRFRPKKSTRTTEAEPVDAEMDLEPKEKSFLERDVENR